MELGGSELTGLGNEKGLTADSNLANAASNICASVKYILNTLRLSARQLSSKFKSPTAKVSNSSGPVQPQNMRHTKLESEPQVL